MSAKIETLTERKIKDAANIVDVVRFYGFETTNRHGKFWVRCPFHNDSDPSLYVGGIGKHANTCHCFACGEHLDPIGFIRKYEGTDYVGALRRLAEIEHIPIYEGNTSAPTTPPPPPPPKPTTPPPPPSYHDKALMMSSMSAACYQVNPLFVFASSLFGADKVKEAFVRYHVGTSRYKVNPWQGDRKSVVFWQVDENGNIRAGKIMPYNTNGRRIHDDRVSDRKREAVFVHAIMTKDFHLCQCLFGQHLMSDAKRINIVESEKTAIIASLYFGDSHGIWVATGGKTAGKMPIINAANLMKGKDVVLYPDMDGVKDWQTLYELMKDIGVNVTLSTAQHHVTSGKKFDICDHIVRLMSEASVDNPTAPPTKELPPTSATTSTPPTVGTSAHVCDTPTAPTTDLSTPTSAAPTAPPDNPVDILSAVPRAPGETEEQARERNAQMLAAARHIRQVLSSAIILEPPTLSDIIVTDPMFAAAETAPF